MSSLARHSTRMSTSSRGESMLIPVSVASALFAAGVSVLLKSKSRRSKDSPDIEKEANNKDEATVVTESDSREGAPVSLVGPKEELDIAPVMEVTTTQQVQIEEMSQQDPTDGAVVTVPSTPEPITTTEQTIEDCADSVVSTASSRTSSTRIFKSVPGKGFCKVTNRILERALDDDEISCDSVHC